MASTPHNTAVAALLQANIMDNSPIEFMVGKKKYRVKRLGNWVAGRIDKLVAKSQFVSTIDAKDPEQVIKTMAMNRKVIPKCIAYMILKHPVKIWFWHWFYWRWINLFGDGQYDYAQIIAKLYSGEEAQFFFLNMQSLQMNNMLMIEMTKADTRSIAQKLASEVSTMSSSPSTAK